MCFAKNVKQLAKIHGITMKEIAEKMGLKPSNFTRTIKNPRIAREDMETIARIIGCEVCDFYHPTKEQPRNEISCPYCGRPISFFPSEENKKR